MIVVGLDIDLEEIESAARCAIPGPLITSQEAADEAVRRFDAVVTPATVLELLDELRAALAVCLATADLRQMGRTSHRHAFESLFYDAFNKWAARHKESTDETPE